MKYSIIKIIIVVVVAFTIGVISCRKNEEAHLNNELSQNDIQFLQRAGIANASKIDLALLLTEKASHKTVKNFAHKIIKEHSKAQTELIELGARKQVVIPNEPDTVHKNIKVKIRKLSGYSLDSAYLINQLNEHKKAVNEFDNASKNAADKDVKKYATQQLPALYQHLLSLDSLVKNLK